MNRKIQETDSLFIVARYKRDPHAFNALIESERYDVTIVTIYNVLSRAGIKMRRGRKPLQAPPAPLILPQAPPSGLMDAILASAPLLKPPVGPKPPLTPKPPVGVLRKGPPIIRPSDGGFGERPDKNAN
jgi:hypothetical protein